MAFCIRRHILEEQPFEHSGRRAGPEPFAIENSVIYSILPRMFTAWDHYREGEICSGTFLKTICLLPFLKTMQVDILYLLPVFKYSDQCKKGRLGSPYAIKNIYQLDPHLHDPLLGPERTLVDLEFRALVEACHRLGIKVMVDFVFRTVARDNDLLGEHPEWFYWIDAKHSRNFRPPLIEQEKPLALLNARSFPSLYQSSGIGSYLAQFRLSPRESDPVRWQTLRDEASRTGRELFDLVEEQFGLTTAPGFSDVLNDNQPLWTDVTYLRFYYDHHPQARPYLAADQPPYILQDVACLNLYPGEELNRELWDYTAQVIPYYQRHYGIDGARIDMGHALPRELNQEIIARLKAENPDFILWSEEFAVQNAQQAKRDGFHFINGELWTAYKKLGQPGLIRQLLRTLTASELPLIAALETPDTSRLALVQDKRRVELLVALNYLLPNGVPFINNGMEIAEKQPMNLGFNDVAKGEYVLEPDDPMYGRLAFFDPYQLHWLNPDREWMRQLLREVLELRRNFRALIKVDYLVHDGDYDADDLLWLGYHNPQTGSNLWLIANPDPEHKVLLKLEQRLPEAFRKRSHHFKVLWRGKTIEPSMSWSLAESMCLEAGETVIGSVVTSI